jgi:toxin secretion/phage lysis holin
MKTIWNTIQFTLTTIGGWLGYFLGGLDGLVYALVIFVVFDYATGVMKSIVEKKLSSEVGARGIFKKVIIFFLVGIAHIIDSRLIGTGSAIRTAVVFFYISNEGISIIENAAILGVPIPQKLKNVLAQLNKEKD